jgi:hypothetical protein
MNIASDGTRAADGATRLIQLYQGNRLSLSTEALAALAQAAALMFDSSGAPGMKAAAHDFAEGLLDARVRVGPDQAFFGSTSRGHPDLEATTDAGNALIDVFRVTNDERYLLAAQSAARAVASQGMGWTRTGKGFAVRIQGTPRLYSIPSTAAAALFLKRAANAGAGRRSATEATSAFHFIDVHQAAVGRWYLNVGAKTPMTLRTWATTLLALASTRAVDHQGIVGGGVPGLWSAAFSPSGTPIHSPLLDKRGLGVALSLRLFQRFAGTASDAHLAYRSILDNRRPDGTIEEARPDDDIAQADYALAFAERALALRRPKQWNDRLV